LNNKLVIVASNFPSFIASLKQNLKLGYGNCLSATFVNGFYRAELLQGIDDAYVAKLANIGGNEKENTLDILDHLANNSVTQEVKPIVEMFDPMKEAASFPKTSDVEISLKKPRKPRMKEGE
jgi:hypothetical protein